MFVSPVRRALPTALNQTLCHNSAAKRAFGRPQVTEGSGIIKRPVNGLIQAGAIPYTRQGE
jgi:hypothetical protein